MVGLVDRIQQIGHPSSAGVIAEVEASHAARSVLRSNDFDHGAFNIGFGGATVATTIAAANNIIIAGFQWNSSRNYAAIKRITGSFNIRDGVGGNNGDGRFFISKANSFTRNFETYAATSNTSFPLIPSTAGSPVAVAMASGNKLRSTMINSDAGSGAQSTLTALTPSDGPSLVYATGGTLGSGLVGGQYVVDPVALSAVMVGGPNLGTTMRAVPPQTFFDSEIGPPLVLENLSGLVFAFDLNFAMAASGVWSYGINIQWDEVA